MRPAATSPVRVRLVPGVAALVVASLIPPADAAPAQEDDDQAALLQSMEWAPRARQRAAAPEPVQGMVGAGAALGAGATPLVGAGIVAGWGARRGELSAALEVRLDLHRSNSAGGGEVSAWRAGATLIPCRHWGTLGAC